MSPPPPWTPATEADGNIRQGAWVAELAGDVLKSRPKGMRLTSARPGDPKTRLERGATPALQLLAAAGLSLPLAMLLQTPKRLLAFATLNGAAAWTTFAVLTRQLDVSPITATGIAARTGLAWWAGAADPGAPQINYACADTNGYCREV